MRRVVLSLLSATAVLLATTSAVLATPPTREPLGLPQVIEFAAGEACSVRSYGGRPGRQRESDDVL